MSLRKITASGCGGCVFSPGAWVRYPAATTTQVTVASWIGQYEPIQVIYLFMWHADSKGAHHGWWKTLTAARAASLRTADAPEMLSSRSDCRALRLNQLIPLRPRYVFLAMCVEMLMRSLLSQIANGPSPDRQAPEWTA